MSALPDVHPECPAEAAPDLPDGWLTLSDPDLSEVEQQLVQAALAQPTLAAGPMVAHFERQFAAWLGRRHAVAVASGTLGTWLALRALGIGPGDEVVASPYGWHQVAHAVSLTGARVALADINYWSGCLDPVRAATQVGDRTRAVLVGNVNGHPADWVAFQALAAERGLTLIEDATESIGSVARGQRVGTFGDVSVFDFSQPSALCCGEGGMVVTDDDQLASTLRYLRSRSVADRRSVSVGAHVPLQAAMGELTAALGAGQLARIDTLLARRKAVEACYAEQMQSFEGIKPPYVAPEVDEVHWMTYTVHLGKRFTASACAQIVDDLAAESIESVVTCQPLHQQFHYQQQGWRRGQFPLAERIADRAIALPFHAHLAPEHVKFIVKTLKDSSVNVGAGAAIY